VLGAGLPAGALPLAVGRVQAPKDLVGNVDLRRGVQDRPGVDLADQVGAVRAVDLLPARLEHEPQAPFPRHLPNHGQDLLVHLPGQPVVVAQASGLLPLQPGLAVRLQLLDLFGQRLASLPVVLDAFQADLRPLNGLLALCGFLFQPLAHLIELAGLVHGALVLPESVDHVADRNAEGRRRPGRRR